MIPLVIKRKNAKCNNGNIYNICGSEMLKLVAGDWFDIGY